jgi:hypothetical protein
VNPWRALSSRSTPPSPPCRASPPFAAPARPPSPRRGPCFDPLPSLGFVAAVPRHRCKRSRTSPRGERRASGTRSPTPSWRFPRRGGPLRSAISPSSSPGRPCSSPASPPPASPPPTSSAPSRGARTGPRGSSSSSPTSSL